MFINMQVCREKEEIRQKRVQNAQFQREKSTEQLSDAARAWGWKRV